MTARKTGRALFKLDEILQATGGSSLISPPAKTEVSSVVIDSRKASPGSLFVALPGERTDGHDHIPEALQRGAAALLVAGAKADSVREILRSSGSPAAAIAVSSTLAGLQDLARFHMGRLPPMTRIGVTGSNGKTTTKEIIGAILSVGSAAAMNEGNLNSEIGLPLSCFSVENRHKFAIFEMGMNRAGEMDVLVDLVRPHHALITNVGSAHIGLLGTKESIAEEKKKIFALFSGGETGYLNEGEPFSGFLSQGVKGKVVFFGPKSTKGFLGSESLGLDGTLIHWEGSRIRFPLFGPYNLTNALGAVSVARELGIPPAEIRDGLSAVKPLFGRSQIVRGPVTVVLDCYNANPDSMLGALSFMEEVEWRGRKIAVLGGMRELGEKTAEAHRAVGEHLAGSWLDAVLLFGEEMHEAWLRISGSPLSLRSMWTADYGVLAARARELMREGDLVLIKGSRGLELERLMSDAIPLGRREVPCS
jgi:UDP-N-acetylmuramoyl-tripeptide--D-alanyl-D-alanine ligase